MAARAVAVATAFAALTLLCCLSGSFGHESGDVPHAVVHNLSGGGDHPLKMTTWLKWGRTGFGLLPTPERSFPNAGGSGERVCGIDERTLVTTTTVDPYKCVCRLSIQFPNGSSYIGTGALVGPRTVLTAGLAVTVRRHRDTPILEAVIVGCALAMVTGFVLGDPGTATGIDLVWLALFGALTMGLGMAMFTVGARRIPSAQAALLGALETPLAPLWFWLAFNEVPSVATFIGGSPPAHICYPSGPRCEGRRPCPTRRHYPSTPQ